MGKFRLPGWMKRKKAKPIEATNKLPLIETISPALQENGDKVRETPTAESSPSAAPPSPPIPPGPAVVPSVELQLIPTFPSTNTEYKVVTSVNNIKSASPSMQPQASHKELESVQVSCSHHVTLEDFQSTSLAAEITEPLEVQRTNSMQRPKENSSDSSKKVRSRPRKWLLTNFPILKLLPELILSVVDHLDYPTAVLLSLSCKRLHDLIPIPQAPGWSQKRAMLRKYRSIRTFAGDRNPPYLCEDCQIWHTFEHMVIWPHPAPENHFTSYNNFRSRQGRVCVRFAVKSYPLLIKNALWIPGQALDRKYYLCQGCNTPSRYPLSSRSGRSAKRCQWNCAICGSCRMRKSWSAYCEICWKPGLSLKMWNDDEGQSLQLALDENKKRTCGLCLGVLGYSEDSREMCRCTEMRHNSTPQMWYE